MIINDTDAKNVFFPCQLYTIHRSIKVRSKYQYLKEKRVIYINDRQRLIKADNYVISFPRQENRDGIITYLNKNRVLFIIT
jgi:hypothetical protein